VKKYLVALCLAALLSGAHAQNYIWQSGNVTPGHLPVWVGNGIIGDGGTAAQGAITSIGVVNNGGPGICVQSNINPNPYSQLCLSVSTAAAASITLQNYGGATPQALNFIINGTSYPFPGSLSNITIGTTPIIGGSNGLCLYVNSGVVGQEPCAPSSITSLTGDVTAIGPGATVATLATVNANVGTFGGVGLAPTFTVNAKGLITSASNTSVTVNASNLTGTTLASNVVTSSLTTVGTIGTGTWQGTAVTGTYGGTGVNNGSDTITLGGNVSTAGAFTTSGSFPIILTATGSTNVTLPVSGTLVNSSVATLSNLTSIGTIGTGVWQGTVVGPTYGGTGVNNGSDTITLGGNILTAGAFVTSGANSLTLTTTGSTNVTLPTTGTLASLGAATQNFTGSLTFSGLSTSGTIAGSMCQTSAGVVLYEVGVNCFAASASSITVGTTTIANGTASTLLYQNGASPTGTIGAVAGATSNGTTLTFANGDLILAGSSSGSSALETSATGGGTITFQAGAHTVASTTLASQVLSGGATVTPNNLTAATTFTTSCGLSPLQWIVNSGNFTINPPTAANSQNCAIRVINGTTAANPGTVTIGAGWSGKTPGGVAFATTATVSAASISFTNSSSTIGWTVNTPAVNSIVFFATSGSLPTNFSTSTLYYVVSSVASTSITVSATPGGSAIVAGSAGSGTQTGYVPSIYDLIVENINSPPYAQWVQVQ
jgi:hypothetical protein